MAFRKIMSDRRMHGAIVVLLLGIALNFWGTVLIRNYVSERPIPPDLLFTYTPYLGWTQYLTDPANAFSVFLLAWYVFHGRTRELPIILWSFGLAEAARGILILLNPLGSPLGTGMRYGITQFLPIEQLGQFPSGHVMLVFLCYYLVSREALVLKRWLLLSIWVEVVALVLSRGHYAIDIVGGFFIAYIAFHEVNKRRERLLLAE